MTREEFLAAALDALLPLLLAALSYGSYQLAAWIKAKQRNEMARGALLALNAGAETVVRELAQTTVEALKAAADDGKLEPEEVDDIRRAALGSLKSWLGPKGLSMLASTLGTKEPAKVDRVLLGAIEAKLHELKAEE